MEGKILCVDVVGDLCVCYVGGVVVVVFFEFGL